MTTESASQYGYGIHTFVQCRCCTFSIINQSDTGGTARSASCKEPGIKPPAFWLVNGPHFISCPLKGIVHPKILIHALSAHHYADGRLGQVFEDTKQFLSFRGKQHCSQIQYNWRKWVTTSINLKQQKKTQLASILLLWCHPVKFDSKRPHSHHVFSLNVRFDLCIKASPEEDSRGHLGSKHGVNNAVSRRIWMSGFADTWMTPHKQYGGI